MKKPPMICQHCSRVWDIEPDEVRCACGQHLFRVMIGTDGQLQGPPSMPEHIRRQMQEAWEQNRDLFTPPINNAQGYREIDVRLSDTDAAPHGTRFDMETRYHGEARQPFVLQPDQVAKDATTVFGRESDAHGRGAFYASWDAYDAALAGMSPLQQTVQRRAEILALEQMMELS